MSQNTEPHHCNGCCCLDAPIPVPASHRIIDRVPPATDTSTVLAEAVRTQSQCILALLSRDGPGPQVPPVIAVAAPEVSPRCDTVLSERIGSISLAQWEAMDDAALLALDEVLMRVVDSPKFSTHTMFKLAVLVRNALATVGLEFKRVDECDGLDAARDFAVLGDKTLPVLVRMKAAASAARPGDDCERWAEEVMRVVVRLMELRGM